MPKKQSLEVQLRKAAVLFEKAERSLPWLKPQDVRVVPEGTITTVQGRLHQEECRFVRGTNEKRGVTPNLSVIAPQGDWTGYVLSAEDVPDFINGMCKCNNLECLVSLIRKWGPLRIHKAFGLAPRFIGCDMLEEWFLLVSRTQMILSLLEEKGFSKHIKGRSLVWSSFEDENYHMKIIPEYPDFLKGEDSQDWQRGIAVLLEAGMKEASLRKEYIVLPQGQIINVDVPADMYSFIWLALEATVLQNSSSRDLCLRKCCYCGHWDIEDGPRERLMRQPHDKTYWYHDACKRREARRTELELRAIKEGREYKIRPGARKQGVQKT